MFFRFTRPVLPLVGVDIGSSHLKAVMLQRDDSGYRVSLALALPLADGDPDAALARLKSLLPKGATRAAAAVSGATVMTKVITMDATLSDVELETQIEIEADNLIPYPLDEINLDFEPTGRPSSSGQVEVLLSACRTEDVQARVRALARAGLKAEVIDVEGYALGRAQVLLEEDQQGDLALVEAGACKSLLAINQDGETRFVREISLERARFAEFSEWVEQLAQQLQRSLQIYLGGGEGRGVPRLVICGHNPKALASLLAPRLGLPCCGARLKCGAGVELQDPARFLLAAGLAMREAP
ncbi:type IV pilus assembly protein PilM [Ferrimonas sediminicola]|uniref:Type IV pilus assembly protein PilM n=1 Tax=Ferrimonas sediminicola TaxID=2569538 RepID=A0A4U1BDH6_9GAMM|nr:type IV pilus assembly protein PilM [Ferrimonas sediminicola]TKB48016.1 type IV pilus assembly protein PilM [Ferrimonas sediminicola]